MGYPNFTFETVYEQFLLEYIEPLSQRHGEELDVMNYLIENVWYWRARLVVDSLTMDGSEVELQVSNLGRASTANATLLYIDENGIEFAPSISLSNEPCTMNSEFNYSLTGCGFQINATNSTQITFDFGDVEISSNGKFVLHYQKRVIDSSMWVTEDVPVDVLVFKSQASSSGAFSGNVGLVFLLAVILMAGIAAWLGREQSEITEEAVESRFDSAFRISDNDRIFDTQASIRDLFHRPSFHEPVVDGVRALAVLWVLIFHAWFFQNPEWTNGHVIPWYDSIFDNPMFLWLVQGGLGVDMFFVISGFLIGAILLREINRSDGLNMRRFYARRFLRLMPVYVVAMMAAIFFLDGHNAENAWANLLYVNNFLSIDDQFMGWCWSLAIEEQFYLIAPFFLLFMRKSEYFLQWSAGLVVLGWGLRIFALEYHDLSVFWDARDLGSETWVGRFNHTYDNFYTRFGGLLIGVIAAWIHVNCKSEIKEFFNGSKMTPLILSFIALTFFLFATFLDQRHLVDSPYIIRLTWYAMERDIFALSLAILIMSALHSADPIARGLRRLLSAKILYPIAQLSYSAYLMHEMVMIWMFPMSSEFFIGTIGLTPNLAFIVNSLLAILITLLSAAILYITVERPCMRFRKHPLMSRIDGTTKQNDDSIPKSPTSRGIIEAEIVTS